MNGELRQSNTTDKMIWDVATVISFFSDFYTLQPGVLIETGTPGGIATRAVITIGAEKGKNDMAVASRPDGSWMMFASTNIGIMIRSMTGMIIDWASLMFVTAAPAATNIEPYIIVPRTVKKRNQRITVLEMEEAMP